MTTDDNNLAAYDHLPPDLAVVYAWTRPGPSPRWHQLGQRDVATAMPLLARAVERLVEQVNKREEAKLQRSELAERCGVCGNPKFSNGMCPYRCDLMDNPVVHECSTDTCYVAQNAEQFTGTEADK